MGKPTMMSLFDGSGGFPLAASMCGIVPVAASEVEPYPIAVTRSRFPNMKHLGSVTDIKGDEVEPVDVITFGSPCQDLSVAGKRAGLKHEENGDDETTRSGLFMEAVRIIKEMRRATNGVYPRFAVWENVPGAFSSNKGEDFRTVCEELIKIVEPSAVMPAVPKNGWPYADCYCGEGWSLAYRVFDAQYWGVPQRRRRIYLVVDFRGECAGEILFEREGLRGYFEKGRAPWQGTAAETEDSTRADDCTRNGVDVVCCIDGDKIGKAERAGGSGLGIRDGDKMYTLTSKDAGSHAVAYAMQAFGKYTESETASALKARDYKDATDLVVEHPIVLDRAFFNQGQNALYEPQFYTDGTCPTLVAKGPSAVCDRYIVRRLTPTECARLQGFADRWAVPDRKEELTDEEYAFWCKVNLDYDRVFEKARPNEDGWYNVWREVKPNKAKGEDFEPYWEDTGKPYTHKNPAQMLKWYNNLRTDSSEYKLWGNGIAFPNALYVMQGISDVINQ